MPLHLVSIESNRTEPFYRRIHTIWCMDIASWVDQVTERDWATGVDGTLRFALIGLGWWTVDVAIPAIEAADHATTTVLVSSASENAKEVAAKHGIHTGISYEAFHEGTAVREYDAIYIGTPNALHLEYAETAASLGKAVLCEKPMEADADRAEQLVSACETEGVPLMIAYRMQTDPLTRRARSLIRAGAIGDPVFAYGSNAQPLLEMNPDEDQWRLDPELAGYGTSVMDLGIYPINTTRFLLDRDPIAAWSGMHSDHPAFSNVPDQWAAFTLTFEDDVLLVSTTSQHAQRDAQLSVTGTEGYLALDPAFHGEVGLTLKRGDATVRLEHDAIDVTREMTEEFDYFADRVLSDGSIHPDGRHGLRDMETIQAIHRSAETGEAVEIVSGD